MSGMLDLEIKKKDPSAYWNVPKMTENQLKLLLLQILFFIEKKTCFSARQI